MAQLGFGLKIDDTAQENGYDRYEKSLLQTLGAIAADNWEYNPLEATKTHRSINAATTESIRGGDDAIWLPDRLEVLEYLKKSPDVPDDACLEGQVCIDKKRVFVYAAPSNTNQGRLWAKIADEIPEESYVVLYTTKKIPSKIKKGYEEFMEYVDWRYKECFEIVNRTFAKQGGSMMKIQPPVHPETGKPIRPWKVLGVIPQLNQDETHATLRKAFKLIPLEDYC